MTNILAKIYTILQSHYVAYKTRSKISDFASFGEGSSIGWPFLVSGTNRYLPGEKFIHIGNKVKLGSGVTIFAIGHMSISETTPSAAHI